MNQYRRMVPVALCQWIAVAALLLLFSVFMKEAARPARGAQGFIVAATTGEVHLEGHPAPKDSDVTPPATIQDFSAYLLLQRGYDNAVVGMIDKRTLLTARYGFDARSTIDFWNLATGKVKAQIVPPTPVQSNSVEISANGNQLLALQNVAFDVKPEVPTPHVVYGWDLQSRQINIQIHCGDDRELRGAFINPRDPTEIVVTDSGLPDPTQNARVTRYDIRSEKLKDVISRTDAWRIAGGYALFSPDGKYLVDFDVPDLSETGGAFDIFDSKTFNIIFRFDGEKDGYTIDKPVFFIDNEKLVLGTTLYDLRTRKAGSVLPHHQNLYGKCLAPVPNRPGYALFLIQRGKEPRGFELWNIRANTVVYRWPLTRRPTRMIGKPDARKPKSEPVGVDSAFVSRDGLAFGFMDDQGVFRVYDYNFNALPATNSPTTAGGQPKTDHHG